jgi:hypothetical protein
MDQVAQMIRSDVTKLIRVGSTPRSSAVLSISRRIKLYPRRMIHNFCSTPATVRQRMLSRRSSMSGLLVAPSNVSRSYCQTAP